MVQEKQHAHELIDRLLPNQVSIAVTFLEFLMFDRLTRRLATAPIDDEEETEEEHLAVQEAEDWLASRDGQGIPHETVLADLGFTQEDFKTR